MPKLIMRITTSVIAALIWLGVPTGALAEEATDAVQISTPTGTTTQGQPFDESDRQAIYEEGRLSHAASVGYNLLLPGLGNLYAQQFFTAGVLWGTLMFSGILVGYGMVNDRNGYTYTGLGVGAATYSASFALGVWGVSDYNRNLRSSLKIHEFAPPKGLTMTLEF